MCFEALANELILDVFDYLSAAQQFCAFHGLNQRLNELLGQHLRIHGRFDFAGMSRHDFDTVSHVYLPGLIEHVTSIHLCDEDEFLEQTALFFADGHRLRQFTQLQSLTLSSIHSKDTMKHIFTELHELGQLARLRIKHCDTDEELVNSGWIFDQIWSLQQLTHCQFERRVYLWNPFFIAPKIISTSIKHLHLAGFIHSPIEVYRLLENTVNLCSLNIELDHNFDQSELPAVIPSIRKFHVTVGHSSNAAIDLIRRMVNLTELSVELTACTIDGHQFEELIDKHLPHLSTFRLQMEVRLRLSERSKGSVDQLLHTFAGEFWTVRHRWYVQCHWSVAAKFHTAHLYTLPCKLNEFSLASDLQFRSTLPHEQIHWSYERVRTLLWQSSPEHPLRFEHVEQLSLFAPLTTALWSIVPNLSRLRSLRLKKSTNCSHETTLLVDLLRTATGLDSLTVEMDVLCDACLFTLRSSSIRRLDLRHHGRFDHERCQALALSPLGTRCEVLLITVRTPGDVLTLVNRMSKLGALHAHCESDRWSRYDEAGTEDQLVELLKSSLPKHCVVRRGMSSTHSYVQVWVR